MPKLRRFLEVELPSVYSSSKEYAVNCLSISATPCKWENANSNHTYINTNTCFSSSQNFIQQIYKLNHVGEFLYLPRRTCVHVVHVEANKT